MTPENRRYAEWMTDRQGLRLAGQLSHATAELPHEVTERLRAARERALSLRKREVAVAAAPAWAAQGGAGTLSWGADEAPGLLQRLSGLVALGVLVLGLVGIDSLLDEQRAQELAAVDVALLTDELPPAAFADPGFIHFLQKEM